MAAAAVLVVADRKGSASVAAAAATEEGACRIHRTAAAAGAAFLAEADPITAVVAVEAAAWRADPTTVAELRILKVPGCLACHQGRLRREVGHHRHPCS